MRRRLAALAAVLFATAALLAPAAETAEEARLRTLSEKLRCLVCQNQSLADSNAELAGDLRRELREQMKAGRNDGEILQFMVARYGDFVLYEPPFKASTLLLWIGPFALLALALVVLASIARRRRAAATAEPELGAEDQRLIERALGKREEPK